MKVAIITGAASGIGLALTQIHLEKGHFVFMVDKDESQLAHHAQQLELAFPNQQGAIHCDITDASQVSNLIEQIRLSQRNIHWIYNNAGIIGTIAPLWELNTTQVHQVIEVNLMGMINIIQGFTPLLFNQSFRSRFINMASLYALNSGSQLAPYAISKHGVLALSESLYFDLKRLNKPIDVSIVFPSFTDTALLSNSHSKTADALHHGLQTLLAHSRPAKEVATHIIQEVEQNKFYILPDREVKGYCEERVQAILLQEPPHLNTIEKLMNSLSNRNKNNKPI